MAAGPYTTRCWNLKRITNLLMSHCVDGVLSNPMPRADYSEHLRLSLKESSSDALQNVSDGAAMTVEPPANVATCAECC